MPLIGAEVKRVIKKIAHSFILSVIDYEPARARDRGSYFE